MPAPTPLQNKTAALGRLLKDHQLYQQEADQQQKKIDDLKANGGDEYEINKATRVLDDTKQMFPEITKKIEQYLASLKEILESGDLEEDTSAAEARKVEVEQFLAKASA